jgi:hypothetical protein
MLAYQQVLAVELEAPTKDRGELLDSLQVAAEVLTTNDSFHLQTIPEGMYPVMPPIESQRTNSEKHTQN